ncbi:uncharacterized protein EV420DRAFT_1265343 [Desarmillaria tabescens]|uniref:NAD(P)-binding protein n=1 Tax=Armillaria tabescens TaxID=1929756 RepID=A0AA39TXU4_ARMTA|nr:uncharacterized protein EV420DRAFT_1265343 [Desarmillaria tabescens]KAK0462630.1 hypothetical protein EV420DRAFT_1265343 [Desarmillaria tabescens]
MLNNDIDLVAVTDDDLFRYTERVKDKVVLITGDSKGIGRETAIRFALYGAKVVIGDQDAWGAQEIVHEIVAAGGTAIDTRCSTTTWDDVVALFDLAVKTYGDVDIVVANTGVTEVGQFKQLSFDSNGKPVKPDLTTVDVNLVGVLYPVHLAQYYLARKRQPNDLKALVVSGSFASWHGSPQAPLYSVSGCGVLGTMRSIYLDLQHKDIRTAVISPALGMPINDTLPSSAEASTKGLSLSPTARVAGSIFHAATNPEKETSGRTWLIRDDGPLYMVPREDLDKGVFHPFNKRFARWVYHTSCPLHRLIIFSRMISTTNAVEGFLRNPSQYLMKPLVIIVLGFFGLYAYGIFL